MLLNYENAIFTSVNNFVNLVYYFDLSFGMNLCFIKVQFLINTKLQNYVRMKLFSIMLIDKIDK